MLVGRFTLRHQVAIVISLALIGASCGTDGDRASGLGEPPGPTSVAAISSDSTSPAATTPTFVPTPTSTPTTTRVVVTSTTTPTTTTLVAATAPTPGLSDPTVTSGQEMLPSTSVVPAAAPTTNAVIAIDAAMPQTNAVFEALARNNAVASVTVRRDGTSLFARASGAVIDGTPATPDSPMLVASVSKIVTGIGIARLIEAGNLTADQVVPWATMGLTPHPGWNDVTIRELLDHTAGMPVARSSWFAGGGDCRTFLPTLLASPPQSHRGAWRYSNGNYCALGLLIETLTGQALDAALQTLVFDPIGEDGVHASTGGLLPTDAPHGFDANRFSRLGGAGVLVVSTDDLTAMASLLRPVDIDTLRAPGIFVDQYGWGHTGTIDGAVSCLWVLENGRTTVAATIAGNSPAKGGDICDQVVPAVAGDLGIGQGHPVRTP